MNIKMMGVDHEKAAIEYREVFSFTKQQAADAMKTIVGYGGVSGCVILSTCNRSEIWVSYVDERETLTPYEMLWQMKGFEREQYKAMVTQREGMGAVAHLYALACGLKSKIFGEDQIITQVKQAIFQARESGAADTVLENLFRSAVTAAKKVKTQIHMKGFSSSVATSMVAQLKETYQTLENLPCLVIGNGEMGRLAAKTLVQNGCDVTMTIRQYHRGEVVIPSGCGVVSYEDRMKSIQNAKVVVSATTSPHCTIAYKELEEVADGKERIFMDLAVPRDIAPDIKTLAGCVLYDIDDLTQGEEDEEKQEKIELAKEILKEDMESFENWYYFRNLVPAIDDISSESASYIENRVIKLIKTLSIERGEKEMLLKEINRASKKATQKIMYGLKDTLKKESWKDCIVGLYKAAMK